MTKSTIIVLVILVLVLGAAYWSTKAFPIIKPENIGCTMEAKICPDGSAVGRVAPSCEFATCPNSVIPGPVTITMINLDKIEITSSRDGFSQATAVLGDRSIIVISDKETKFYSFATRGQEKYYSVNEFGEVLKNWVGPMHPGLFKAKGYWVDQPKDNSFEPQTFHAQEVWWEIE